MCTLGTKLSKDKCSFNIDPCCFYVCEYQGCAQLQQEYAETWVFGAVSRVWATGEIYQGCYPISLQHMAGNLKKKKDNCPKGPCW